MAHFIENMLPSGAKTVYNNVLYDTGKVKFQLPPEQIKENESASIQFNIDIRNLIFRAIGLYSTKVMLNNKELGEYKIQVIAGE